MGTYKRLPRGKQKPHDEFKDWTVHALVWVKNNWQTAIEIVAVAAVAFAVVVGASTYWRHRSQSAAEKLYDTWRLAQGSDERTKKLEEIVDDYSRTPAGQQAMMEVGDVYLFRKEYDKAIDEFRMLAGRSRNHPIIKVAALHRLAAAQLEKGDALAAAEAYLKAAADPGNLLGATSRYHAAACFERAGDPERAAALYRQAMEDAGEGDRALRDRAEERLIWLVANNLIKG